MASLLYILCAILLLGILVVVHEAGHFFAARLTGIDVQEFSVGFGPKLLQSKPNKKGTKFSLRLVPLGGYCAFYGEDDPSGKGQQDARALNKHPAWKRIIMVLMGPIMNFLLAFVVCAVFYMISGETVVTGVMPYVAEVEKGGPADAAGMMAGDVITKVNGGDVLDGTQQTLIDAISAYDGTSGSLMLSVTRDGQDIELDVIPFFDETSARYRVGITVGGNPITEHHVVTPLEAIVDSWEYCKYASTVIVGSLRDLIFKGEGLDQASGPVGIIATVSNEVRTGGIESFIALLIVISINLGIMNLLPIPGLDGSRFIFLVIEVIRRKPVKPEREAVVNLIGMALLFALAIYLTFHDVVNLFH